LIYRVLLGSFHHYDSYWQYFGQYDEYKADDGPHRTKVNDLVLIRNKENPERVDLLYETAEVVVREGQAQDPLTGQRVLGDTCRVDFAEDMHKINALLPDRGKCQETLKYAEDDVASGTPQSPRDKS
jgi:hypothetical protein